MVFTRNFPINFLHILFVSSLSAVLLFQAWANFKSWREFKNSSASDIRNSVLIILIIPVLIITFCLYYFLEKNAYNYVEKYGIKEKSLIIAKTKLRIKRGEINQFSISFNHDGKNFRKPIQVSNNIYKKYNNGDSLDIIFLENDLKTIMVYQSNTYTKKQTNRINIQTIENLVYMSEVSKKVYFDQLNFQKINTKTWGNGALKIISTSDYTEIQSDTSSILDIYKLLIRDAENNSYSTNLIDLKYSISNGQVKIKAKKSNTPAR